MLKKKIKFLAICNKNLIPLISNDIDFYIRNKIKIVQASNNFDVLNHGFIIEKPFKDYSFEELFLRKTLKLNKSNVHKIFKNKIILITGGAGSIGGGLVKKLIDLHVKKIIILDINEYNIFKLKNSIQNKNKLKNIEFCLTNIENYDLLSLSFKKYKPDIVFNTAALKHVEFLEKNPRQGFLTNVLGTSNVLEVSSFYEVKYFIHISSDKAADPENVLGYTKLISEYAVKSKIDKKMKIGTVRFGNVFNSFGSVAETFKNKIFNLEKIQLSHPDVERYFMSLDEAVNLIINSVDLLSRNKNSQNNKIFICDMGLPIKIKELAYKMLYLCGRDPKKNISTGYYGLKKNNEKLTEKLISSKEKIINYNNDLIFEIIGKHQIINKKKIENILSKNFTEKKFIQYMKNFINK